MPFVETDITYKFIRKKRHAIVHGVQLPYIAYLHLI